jgi:hypothetical protein
MFHLRSEKKYTILIYTNSGGYSIGRRENLQDKQGMMQGWLGWE